MENLAERPTPGESTFGPDGPDQFRAAVDIGRGDWRAFAWGFKGVAERAALHLEAKGQLVGWEVYGFIFLWRHYLELSLKTLVQVLAQLGEVSEIDAPMRRHQLLPLWQKLAPSLHAQDGGGPPGGPTWAETLPLIERIVLDFDNLDPNSFESRYPGNLARTESTLQEAPAFINVGRLNRRMLWLAHQLDAVFDALTCGDDAGFAMVSDSEEARVARAERHERELDEMYAKAEPLRRAIQERIDRESGKAAKDDEPT